MSAGACRRSGLDQRTVPTQRCTGREKRIADRDANQGDQRGGGIAMGQWLRLRRVTVVMEKRGRPWWLGATRQHRARRPATALVSSSTIRADGPPDLVRSSLVGPTQSSHLVMICGYDWPNKNRDGNSTADPHNCRGFAVDRTSIPDTTAQQSRLSDDWLPCRARFPGRGPQLRNNLPATNGTLSIVTGRHLDGQRTLVAPWSCMAR